MFDPSCTKSVTATYIIQVRACTYNTLQLCVLGAGGGGRQKLTLNFFARACVNNMQSKRVLVKWKPNPSIQVQAARWVKCPTLPH